jgi:hypothetical protein
MSKEDYRIVICDMPDREELVAEVHYKNNYWVEISAETPNKFVIQYYNKENGNCWEFPFAEAMDVLQQAKDMLAEKQRTPAQQKEYDEMMEIHRIELESKNNLRE